MNRACSALVFVLFVTVTVWAAAQSNGPETQNGQQGTAPPNSISADMGSCRVTFKVTNFAGKPIYNAKIHTRIKSGFLGLHKLDLDIGTNYEGRAQFTHMPNAVKSPLLFHLRNGSDEAIITWDPGTNCDAEYTVPLLRKSRQKQEQETPPQ